MSMYELPNNLLKEIVDAGMETGWKQTLGIMDEETRWEAARQLKEKLIKSSINDPYRKKVVRLFLEVAPLLAENKAISKAARKNPMIRQACPEILTVDEALELARMEAQETPEDWNKIYHRLRGMLRNRPTQRQEKD